MGLTTWLILIVSFIYWKKILACSHFLKTPGLFYITEIEMLSKRGITIKQDILIRNMLASCLKIGHQQEISELAIKLRRRYFIKLPDAIIAATSQFSKVPILTADKGFAQIKEIDCFILEM